MNNLQGSIDRRYLLDTLLDRFDIAFLESCSMDTLQDLYSELEKENKLEAFLPGELEVFKKKSLLTQEQLLDNIRQSRETFAREAAQESGSHTAAFYTSLDRLMEKFWSKVARATLPEPLPDWWQYSYQITANGIKLTLNHVQWSYCASFDCCRDQRFTLIEVPAKLLTVSEFAQLHGILEVTVRLWIRRGKIRSAVKAGKEWRIPELAELRKDRGYVPCRYNWSAELTDLPDKFRWINRFESALFAQDEQAKNLYRITLDPRGGEHASHLTREEQNMSGSRLCLGADGTGTLLLSSQEREELELYMISSSLIHCGPKEWENFFNYQIAEFGADYCNYLIVGLSS